MTEPAGNSTLARDVIQMLIREIPCIAWLGEHMSMIQAEQDDRDKAAINVTIRPIDFAGDCVRVVASMRIESVAREAPQPTAITAAAHTAS